MRRIPVALLIAAMLFSLSACGNASDQTQYLSLPFTAEARVSIESSEYLVSIAKGGANLVSVTVKYPEAFYGMTVSLGEESAAGFRGAKITRGFPRSIAELIYDAFNEANRTDVFSDGESEVVRFSSDRGSGSVRVDAFSSVPLSIESEGVYIEFTDFQR